MSTKVPDEHQWHPVIPIDVDTSSIWDAEIAKMVAQITMLAKEAEALAKYSLDMLAAIGGNLLLLLLVTPLLFYF